MFTNPILDIWSQLVSEDPTSQEATHPLEWLDGFLDWSGFGPDETITLEARNYFERI